uniref:SecY-independent transporter protein n=1 Tax=Chlorella sorokiniana TaxID=3076 RepID=A0A076EF23_CHLSO|nr:SecY-independent transporter protein [Chlorella sorokiniana]YP_010387301.1 tatC [Chlorella ohadii]AII02120.1 SecY-independent transporter protein [Chlorella sorokiniana]AIM56871.1 SecY-independent transporter protein [Chlorella sorokiniana]UPO68037.1 tatC [Chlorella ohadii]
MVNFQYHLFELKLRGFYLILSAITTFFICWNYQLEIVYILGRPFIQLHQTFIFLELTEAFYTLVKISLILTLFLLLPLVLYHFWCFLIPSFYQMERSGVNFLYGIFLLLVLSEFLFTYFFLLPKIFHFLLSFEMSSASLESFTELSKQPLVSVEFNARIACYVKLVVKIITTVLVLFQIPFGISLLYSKKMLKVSSFYFNRKYLAGTSLLVSAFIVPPDFSSQLGLAFLFYMLFEFLIFIGLFFEEEFQP